MLLTARLGSGEVSIGAGYELDIIAAAVIGGLRFGAGSAGVSPIGMLLGVAVMSVMRSALSLLDIPSAFQPIVLGCAILLAMGLERMRSIRRSTRSSDPRFERLGPSATCVGATAANGPSILGLAQASAFPQSSSFEFVCSGAMIRHPSPSGHTDTNSTVRRRRHFRMFRQIIGRIDKYRGIGYG